MPSTDTDHVCYDIKEDPYRGTLISPRHGEPPYIIYNDGFKLGRVLLQHNQYKAIAEHDFLKDDLIVATYPKCGTTLTTQIIDLLNHDAQNTCDNQNDTLMLRFPFAEVFGFPSNSDTVSSQYKTHLPLNRLKYCKDKGKWIAILRNPKDCCVSYFHFAKGQLGWDFDGDFDTFFDVFYKGDICYGNCLEWMESYIKEMDNANLYIILYDNLVENKAHEIQRLGNFLGGKAMEVANDPAKLNSIIEQTSVESMRKAIDKVLLKNFDLKGEKFIRQGKNRDWKNYFTKEQSDLIDALYAYKFKGTKAEHWFEESMKW